MNEKLSPELLYHKTEIMECIEEQIEQAVSPICSISYSVYLTFPSVMNRSLPLAEHPKETLCPVFTNLR